MKRIIVILTLALFSTGLFAQNQKDSLSILLFGHSFGVDCTEHLPKLIDAAGIRTVRLARFFKGNCSMEQRYELFKNGDTKGFSECFPGETEWRERPCSFRQIVSERAWDYVIFQNSLENEGRYETSQPYLDEMVSYVRETQKKEFGREPSICWNLFWPVSYLLENTQNDRAENRLEVYGGKSIMVWDAYVAATKELSQKTGITCIIPSGTAVMNARESAANAPAANAFTRDGYHMSMVAGRYLAACSWFEYFIAPKYGVSIVGNPLRMPDQNYAVEDWNAPILQECAAAAVRNPYVITPGIGGNVPHRKRLGVLSAPRKAKGNVLEVNEAVIAKWQKEANTKWNAVSSSKLALENMVNARVSGNSDAFAWKGGLDGDSRYVAKTVSYFRQISPLLAESVEIEGVSLVKASKRTRFFTFRDRKGLPSAVLFWLPRTVPGGGELPGCVSLAIPEGMFKNPVAVDIRNGEVWEVLSSTENGVVTLSEIPFYDSPVVIVDRKSVRFK